MSKIFDAIRKAIKASAIPGSELSRKAIIDPGQLSRFMRGTIGLSVEAVERVAKVLNLKIEITSKQKGR